jgi:hypothetical protein
MIKRIILLVSLSLLLPVAYSNEALEQLIARIQESAPLPLSAERGAEFWQQVGPNGIHCSSCHGTNVKQPGEHIKTGKRLEPMALSENPNRLSDIKFVEKWLYRNCKAVWSRECNNQEKGDVLLWLSQQ